MIVQISELHSWFTIPNSQIRDILIHDYSVTPDSWLHAQLITRLSEERETWTIHETALLNLWFRLLSSNRESWFTNVTKSRFTIRERSEMELIKTSHAWVKGRRRKHRATHLSLTLWLVTHACDDFNRRCFKKIHSLFVICNHESRITNYTPQQFVFTIANRHSINDSWFRTKFCHNLESPIVNITDPRSLCKLARLGSNKAAEQEAVLAFWIVNGLRSSPLWSANHESNHEGI